MLATSCTNKTSVYDIVNQYRSSIADTVHTHTHTNAQNTLFLVTAMCVADNTVAVIH